MSEITVLNFENKRNNYPISSGIVCLKDFYSGRVIKGDIHNRIEEFQNSLDKKYIIPFYQRPYEWEWKDKELKGLFKSFFYFPETDDDDFDVINDYVIFGTIQLNATKDGFEIIDGQQRLTSFWLFVKAIESVGELECNDNLKFDLINNISEKYNSQFSNYCIESQSRYSVNYRILKDEISDIIGKYPSVFSAERFRDFLLDHVLFSLMVTTYDEVQNSIKLFDSLNTTGLDLGVKDVFKIKYFEFIKKNEDRQPKEIFQRINDAYGKCLEGLELMYQISENDLLDTFKLWIVLNDNDRSSQDYLAKKMKASSQLFFVDDKYNVWQKYETFKSLDTFSEIATTLNQTQSIIGELDNVGPNENVSSMLLSTYELTQNCGYWYFRNILFILTHSIRMRKKDDDRNLDKNDVIRAMRTSQLVWKICSIVKVRDLRVVDDVLKAIPESLFSFVKDNVDIEKVDEELIKFFNKKNDSDEEYRKVYIQDFVNTIEGDVYHNRQCRFLVGLIYLDDCDKSFGTFSWKQQKEKLFYLTQKVDKSRKFEVEHIASQVFGTKIEELGKCVDHIGNLLFLSSKVNKALGKQTAVRDKTIAGLEEDFFEKIQKDCPHWNYLNEQSMKVNDDITDVNISVGLFLNTILNDAKIAFKDILVIIYNRDSQKQEILKAIYRDFLPL